jgi:hypothetical protein
MMNWKGFGRMRSTTVFSIIKLRRMILMWNVVSTGEMTNAHRILGAKYEGRRLTGRPRHGWEDNIKVDLIEHRWVVVDWIELAEDREQRRSPVDIYNVFEFVV